MDYCFGFMLHYYLWHGDGLIAVWNLNCKFLMIFKNVDSVFGVPKILVVVTLKLGKTHR